MKVHWECACGKRYQWYVCGSMDLQLYLSILKSTTKWIVVVAKMQDSIVLTHTLNLYVQYMSIRKC